MGVYGSQIPIHLIQIFLEVHPIFAFIPAYDLIPSINYYQITFPLLKFNDKS